MQMKKRLQVSVFLTLAVVFSTFVSAADFQQNWTVQLSAGEKGGPCESAVATLIVRSTDETIVSQHALSLKPEYLGIAVTPLVVKFPEPGTYNVQADLVRCDGTAFATEPIPVRVATVHESMSVLIFGNGDKSTWQFEYFGLIKERSGNDVLQVGPAEPLTLKNISSSQLQPCRLMLGAQIQVLELIGEEWFHGMQYQFPDALSDLGSGESVVLEVPPVRSFRGKAKDEPKPTGYALRINVLPREGSFQHLVAVDNPDLSGPWPGICDALYVDFEWPKSVDGD